MNRELPRLLLVLLAVCLSGCGGASHPGNSTPATLTSATTSQATGAVALTVIWPPLPVTAPGARPRLVPEAAQSIKVSLTGAGQQTLPPPQILVRPTGQTVSRTLFTDLPGGTVTVAATAYPNSDGTGTALAAGNVSLAVTPGATVQASLTMASTINHLGITPAGPTVAVGATTPLTATAYDAAGDVVLTTPSKLTWASSDTTKATVDASSGVVTGVAAGTPTITVTDSESGKTGSITVSVGASGGGSGGTVQIVGSATIYPTIQAAINAAQSGDTVLVGDGTYTGPGNVDIDFLGKNLTLKSQHGPASTIIDCQGSASSPHRGIYIHSGETDVTVNGFTVKNGYAPTGATDGSSGNGGGAFIDASGSATATNCTFTGDTASNGGGGGGGAFIFASGSAGSATATNCTFTGDTASNGGGGGAFIDASGSATATNCTFTGDTASAGGGAFIDASGSAGSATATNCTFTGDTASNSAGGGGGGAFIDASGSATATNCTFTGDTASNGGGGGAFIDASGSAGSATATNCTFTGDTAPYGGGAYIYASGSATATNCTFTGDTAPYGGGAYIYAYGSAGSATATNCIFWVNIGGEISAEPGRTVAVSNSDVQGGIPSGVTDGGHNINADPKFVRNPNTTVAPPDYGDLHLQPGSPCLGAGATQAEAPSGVTIPTTDLDGHPRPSPPSMGAYE